MTRKVLLVLSVGLPALAPADRALAQASDPFQSVRPTAPTAPVTPAEPTRSAPSTQPGLRVAPPPAGGLDGVWSGTITCDPVGSTTRPLNTPFSLTVANGSVRYERRIFQPDGQWFGDFERGTGTVAADGGVTLTGQAVGQGTAAGSRGQMNYSGRTSGGAMNLQGQQMWTGPRGTPLPARACTIRLSRG